MGWLKGITIILYEKNEAGKDKLGVPVYSENPVEVENVLVSPSSTADSPEAANIDGRKAAYVLAIPKGDTHEWENRKVRFFGRDWKTVGIAQEGIDELVPLDWNRKVLVEAYE